MFPKPVEPLLPIIVKDTVVVELDFAVAIVTLEICALVMFPLIVRSTVEPVFVVAGRVVSDGVIVGVVLGTVVGAVVGVDIGVTPIVNCIGAVFIP